MKVLVIGDTHLPWVNWDCVAECAKFAKWYKPDVIVQLGDLVDQHRWSRHMLYADSPSAEVEWNMTEESVRRFLGFFPSRTPFRILEGNHCRRYMIRATEAHIPKKLIKAMHEIFRTRREVEWHLDTKPLVIDGTSYIHGDEMGGGIGARSRRLGNSLVFGHLHQAFIIHTNSFNKSIFEFCAGCMMDGSSIAARYAAKNPMTCSLGWGTVEDGKNPQYYTFG